MQALLIPLMIVVVGGAVWYVVSTIRIMDYMQKHNQKINWFLIRLLLPKYVSDYQKMTRQPDGGSDPVFRQWLASIAVMGLAALAIVAIRVMR